MCITAGRTHDCLQVVSLPEDMEGADKDYDANALISHIAEVLSRVRPGNDPAAERPQVATGWRKAECEHGNPARADRFPVTG